MKKELWKILPQRAQEAHAIADFLGLPPLAASVLAARGYGPESAKALLSCEDVLCDPHSDEGPRPRRPDGCGKQLPTAG